MLVAGKAVLVKVNVTNANTAEAKPAGTLRVETSTGELVQQLALTAPTGAVPTTVPDVPSFTNSYSVVVPATLVKTGLRLTASVGPGAGTSTINPRVGGGVAMRVVAVPVQLGTTVGQIVDKADSYLLARLPVATVTVQARAPYVSKRVTTLPTTAAEWSTAFSRVLAEMDDLHILEKASDQTFYYGFMPKRTFGLAGVGYVPGNAAVGFDVPNSPAVVRETLAHELGHNLSLPHAPCGGVAGADPQYPYANGMLGAPGRYIWGYNAETSTFVDPRRTNVHDIMSYCSGDTFSDYNYRRVQVYLTPTDRLVKTASAAAAAAGPQELLLISGQLEGGKMELMPLKSLQGEARLPQDGPYTLRVLTAQGTVEYRFAMKVTAHESPAQRFGFTIPNPGTILGITIVKDGATLVQRVTAAPRTNKSIQAATDKSPVQFSEQGGQLRLSWDHAKHPYLTVIHVGTQRTTLAQDLEGGSVVLPAAGLPVGGAFEFSLSDGLNTARVTLNR
ncbi:MAG: hypothetical protein AD742_13085 [Methylibium sp. NZG]|nr:MAG: hypothetical protein AD742_13085 [Methylibium sp. NZG]